MNKKKFIVFNSSLTLKPGGQNVLSFFLSLLLQPSCLIICLSLSHSRYNWLMTFSSCESTTKEEKRESVCAGAQPYALLLAVLLPVRNPTVMYSCSRSWAYDPATIPMLLSRPPAMTTGRWPKYALNAEPTGAESQTSTQL